MISKESREILILKEIEALHMPAGAIYLSQKLGIPQGSLGRILTELEEKGLLAKEQNKGRIITTDGMQYLANYEYRCHQINSAESLINIADDVSKERLLEIVEMRILLECAALKSTCEKITSEQMKYLEDILLDNTYEIKKGLTGEKSDLNFHLTLAKYSGNMTLHQTLSLLLTQKHSFTKLSNTRCLDAQSVIEQHNHILEGLKLRNSELARNAMKSHLEDLITEIHLAYPD